VEDIAMAKDCAVIDEGQEKFLNENWPGPVTIILKGKTGLAPLVYKNGTIALRQPSSKLIESILKSFKKPLAQTSVNISGQPFLMKIKEIVDTFSNTTVKPDLIIDAGNLIKNKPSTIIDLTNKNIKIIRY
jgi:L-threonylcarbamoyladenylate synthase